MGKISANIKKFVRISLIILETLTVLTACGSKESKKSEQSSFSSSINNNESIQSSSSNSSSTNSSSSSSSSSSTQEGFGDVPQILLEPVYNLFKNNVKSASSTIIKLV